MVVEVDGRKQGQLTAVAGRTHTDCSSRGACSQTQAATTSEGPDNRGKEARQSLSTLSASDGALSLARSPALKSTL